MAERKAQYCCKHCGAKETNHYVYKGDVTRRSFQVRFSCGRIVARMARNDWKKWVIKPCGRTK